MSLERKPSDDVEPSTPKPKTVEESVGSLYALQVALQTMKERCQHLQNRLGKVEQENLRLRIENRKHKSDTEDSKSSPGDLQSKIHTLEESVAELSRMKSQLTHHLFMVANENKQLWGRLSHLTEANHNLGSHLSKISHTLSRHHSASSIITSKSQSPTNSLTTDKESKDDLSTASTAKAEDVFRKTTAEATDESLEEISLKLIKSFLQEKTELEEQYAQMVEIQSDSYSIPVQDLGFGYLQDGDETTTEDLKQHLKSLLETRDAMVKQQEALKTSLTILELSLKEHAVCNHCKQKSSSTEDAQDVAEEMDSLRKWGSSEAAQRPLEPVQLNIPTDVPVERMCPMCGKLYDKTVPFATFSQHVTDHFGDDEETLINNFEVIT